MNKPVEPDAALVAVKKFLSRRHKLLIGGEWVDAVNGQTFETIDPATEKVLTNVAKGEKADVDKAVVAARKAFKSGEWPLFQPSQRAKLLWKIADLIEANADELALLESMDNGKPVAYAKVVDVAWSVEFLRYMAGWPSKMEGATIPISFNLAPPTTQFHAYTRLEPVGVVGQIIPWNLPLLMAAWKIGPALATGCTVILKPAEETPLTALRLGELLLEAGVPAGVVNIVTGFGETAGAAIAEHPGIDKVAFTGSTEVGKIIVRAAAGNLKKLTLELGGKSPNVIFDDADIEQAVAGAANAIFFNSGQICSAGSRLYVQDGVYDKVVAALANAAKGIKVGVGTAADTQMGPIVSAKQFARVSNYIDIGRQEGGRISGGKKVGDSGYFLEPTLIADTSDTMRVVQEEIFGPVVTVGRFKDLEDIAEKANDTQYGLAAAVWTRDVSKAHKFAARVQAGTVWVNTYHVLDAALPFGGFKQSGWGREMGRDVLRAYTETKSVVVQL
ncbi:phenylacetaldehyde dehydrogenase [Panacagrimonas perspica]|uniref:Phenylacetaldehyde dehydrogenase n=1 Tax=Panacagrimonas perspica TaxID=381431 RepID=A0A4S3K2U2_9GAMM|nr:aldehyde dehydrogenase family protein [Panacagrimonas perspica]TDU28899.1 phenylacetaldehyde dehydrogenase [Panacagrimonas perspica]THD02276.1 betaine-aldehyde dehydrogenase [Panacagrimonas perspica]